MNMLSCAHCNMMRTNVVHVDSDYGGAGADAGDGDDNADAADDDQDGEDDAGSGDGAGDHGCYDNDDA